MKKLLCLLLIFSVTSCSLSRLVVRVTHPLILGVQKSCLEEKNIMFAEQAFPGLIKLAEGIFYTEPSSVFYASKLAFLYGAYCFAYLDETPFDEFDRNSEFKKQQILDFYRRSKYFALQALSLKHKNCQADIYDKTRIDKFLMSVKNSESEALFWLCFSWAMEIFTSLEDPKALSELWIIEKLALHSSRIDPEYFCGGAFSILAAYWGARSDLLGGSSEKAREFYSRALEYNKNRSLIPHYVNMRYISIVKENASEFEDLAANISNFNAGSSDTALINEVIKKKAVSLFSKKDNFF